MDIKATTQGPGVAPAIPRPGSGHMWLGRGGTEARRQPGTKPAAVSGAQPSIPGMLFDSNRDGAIENWSFSHGGDSFATFTPPPAGSGQVRVRRSNDALPGFTGHHPHATDRNGRVGTSAAIHHAHDAYQRDGLANAAPTAAANAGGTPSATNSEPNVSTADTVPVPTSSDLSTVGSASAALPGTTDLTPPSGAPATVVAAADSVPQPQAAVLLAATAS